MPFVEQDTSWIYYEVSGSGPALVLLHGVGGSTETWRPGGYIDAFSAHFTTVAIDIRGFGQSSVPQTVADFSIKRQADDVGDVLDAIGIERTSLFGFSMGGHVAAVFATEYPERVQALVIASSNPESHHANFLLAEGRSFSNRFRRLTPRRAIAAVWRRVAARIRPPRAPTIEHYAEGMNPMSLEAQRSGQFHLDADRAAERLNMPTLLFQGDRDDIFSARLSREFAMRLSDGEFKLLKGQGHGTLERPDIVQPIVESFLLAHRGD